VYQDIPRNNRTIGVTFVNMLALYRPTAFFATYAHNTAHMI